MYFSTQLPEFRHHRQLAAKQQVWTAAFNIQAPLYSE